MKKIITIITIALLLTPAAFSYTAQKVYPVDSPLYTTLCDIYRMAGHAMPFSSGPWSAAELMHMAKAIDRSEVPPFMKSSYDAMIAELEKDLDDVQTNGIDLEISGLLAIETYSHTNVDGATRTDVNGTTEKTFVGRENWAYDLTKPTPFLDFQMQVGIKDHSYIYFGMPLQSNYHISRGYEQEIGSTNISTSLVGFQNMKFKMIFDINVPYRTFLAIGSENWNLQMGRDRISWGLGTTGNMVISDTLPYHEMIRFSAFSERFKFTYLVSSFPHKANFYDPSYVGSSTNDKSANKGISLYIAHRLEGKFLSDRLSVSITEAIMYASESGVISLRSLNPVMVFHNLYTAADSNSTLAIEMDYTPIKGLNLYLQAIVDDLAVGEAISSPTSTGYPNAIGLLGGMTYSTKAGSGLLRVNLEAAYTSPYLYLRYNESSGAADTDKYGLDYVVAVRTYATGDDSVIYDEFFLGYKYGGDAIVTNLNVSWKDMGKLKISSNAFFMAHGTHDKWTRWAVIGNNGQEAWNRYDVTPTTGHETVNYRYDDEDLDQRDAVCYTLDLGLYASYDITDSFNAFMQLDHVSIWNQFNRSTLAKQSDLQLVLGAKYRF